MLRRVQIDLNSIIDLINYNVTSMHCLQHQCRVYVWQWGSIIKKVWLRIRKPTQCKKSCSIFVWVTVKFFDKIGLLTQPYILKTRIISIYDIRWNIPNMWSKVWHNQTQFHCVGDYFSMIRGPTHYYNSLLLQITFNSTSCSTFS